MKRAWISPELDSRILVGVALDLDLNQQIASARRTLNPEELGRIDQLAQRRLSGEPIARILGYREFWGLRFELAPATLVPRPETESVVEETLAFLDEMEITAPRIADLGTGTGAILLSLLQRTAGRDRRCYRHRSRCVARGAGQRTGAWP